MPDAFVDHHATKTRTSWWSCSSDTPKRDAQCKLARTSSWIGEYSIMRATVMLKAVTVIGGGLRTVPCVPMSKCGASGKTGKRMAVQVGRLVWSTHAFRSMVLCARHTCTCFSSRLCFCARRLPSVDVPAVHHAVERWCACVALLV